ncbi:phosphoribosylamine--glycine ligase [Ignavibacteria bacterium]|nr:phosphoribosylamine--glycine ligase [Bacteroidota bacterium]
MNILLIGSGGREHAIAWKLRNSPSCKRLFAVPGNPGVFTVAEPANISTGDANNVDIIAGFCQENKIELTVIGPEQPLADGLADDLRERGFAVFGPSRAAAQIEWSKGFAKEFMQQWNIPTADFSRFTSYEEDAAVGYAEQLVRKSGKAVIKADGLAAGKGVIIAELPKEAADTVRDILGGMFGKAGASVVIEEFLQGEEASIFAVSDGVRYVTLAPAQDHKRIGEGDTGKNTGGMGAYCPAPIVTHDVLRRVCTEIIEPTLAGMSEQGTPFIGCLFIGLMICDGAPKVVEFNSRFGDPETQAVLTVFEGDFARLLYSAAIGNLDFETASNTQNGYACNVVLASKGYPDAYGKGSVVTGIERAEALGAYVFQAGTAEQNGEIVSAGGRVVGVCAHGTTLRDAVNLAYRAVDEIKFDGKTYRRDIAARAL